MLLIIQLQIFGVNIDGVIGEVQEVAEDILVPFTITLIACLNHLQKVVGLIFSFEGIAFYLSGEFFARAYQIKWSKTTFIVRKFFVPLIETLGELVKRNESVVTIEILVHLTVLLQREL